MRRWLWWRFVGRKRAIRAIMGWGWSRDAAVHAVDVWGFGKP
jgi:hypothetical protein